MTTSKPADNGEHKQSARLRTGQSGLEAAREHREDLEALASTDLPASKWARRLLAVLDEQDRREGGGGQ